MKKHKEVLIKVCSVCPEYKPDRESKQMGKCKHFKHKGKSGNPKDHSIFDCLNEIDPSCPLPDYELSKEEKKQAREIENEMQQNLLKKIKQTSKETDKIMEHILPKIESTSGIIINVSIGEGSNKNIQLNITL